MEFALHMKYEKYERNTRNMEKYEKGTMMMTNDFLLVLRVRWLTKGSVALGTTPTGGPCRYLLF